MSSLRLALKQSLEDVAPAVLEGEKKRRNKKLRKDAVTKRGARPGESLKMKRKRGRPRKHPRPEDLVEDGELGGSASGTAAGESTIDGISGHPSLKPDQSYDDDGSSSENEFSYDEEEEADDNSEGEEGEDEEGDDGHDEDEDDDDDGEDDDDDMESGEEEDGSASKKPSSSAGHHQSLRHISSAETYSTHPDGGQPLAGGETTVDDEARKQRKMLKKKLKHSAANKIQNQWKKKKGVPTEVTDAHEQDFEDAAAITVSGKSKGKGSGLDGDSSHTQASSPSKEHDGRDDEKPAGKKKKSKIAGVVPPPTADVLEWARSMTEKKCRKYVDTGLRVKVRFATKVKKDGKLIKKKIWYGGRIAAVSKRGTKIRIKYDDGTSEVAKFPDDDVVVDAVMNGEHAKPADRFLPPSDDGMEVEILEEGEVDPVTSAAPGPPNEVSSFKSPEGQERSKSPEVQVDVKVSENESTSNEKGEKRENDEGIGRAGKVEYPQTGGVTESSNSNALTKLAAPEEGELSPGITTQRRPVVDVTRTKSIPAPEDTVTCSSNEPLMGDVGKSLPDIPSMAGVQEAVSIAPKTKLATSVHAREVTKDVSSPKSTPVASVEKETSIDNILVDTPVNDVGPKRKREDNDQTEDEPAKSKVKVDDNPNATNQESKGGAESRKGTDASEVNDSSELMLSILSQQHAAAETSEIDLALPHHTGKKKKKKSERAKSPGPRSPVPKSDISAPELTDGTAEDSTLIDKDMVAIEISKEALPESSFKALDGELDDGTKQSTLKSVASSNSFGGTSRGGRKAAQQAKEKLNTKEKDALTTDTNKKKKKRQRMDEMETEVEGTEDLSKGPEWVQCDSCSKWRILPADVKVSSLPNLWYCHMNIYDLKRNTCDAPEQSAKQALKERKRALKKAKRMEAEAQQLEAKREKLELTNTPVNSPKPTKSVKSMGKMKEQAESKKKTLGIIAEEQRAHPDSESESQNEEIKKGKKAKSKESVEDVPEALVDAKKPGRKRGRPARNHTSSTPHPQTRDSQDEDNVEWVQCEKCEKWRKLPPDISADELPDTWYCSMNTWNPSSASCNAAEDKADAQHHEVGSSEWQLRQTHAGKYSYRQMIFGTGARKQNRPLSERSRAAESLFVKPVSEDEENPIPTTQYSRSSAFLPRTSNFNKTANIMLNEDSIGIFDVLSQSNLWAQLRAIEQTKPMKVESGSPPNFAYPKFVTYENLPDDIKTGMQEVVLQILGNSALPGDAVINEARRYPWENKGMVGCCNADVIINTLLALVRDGIVEMATSRDQNIPMSQWIPKYRRVRSERALAAEEAIKSSRCMKIAKPWKQQEEAKTEWITGQQAFH